MCVLALVLAACGNDCANGGCENDDITALLQTDRTTAARVAANPKLMSGFCSQPITVQAECMQAGNVVVDTSIKNADGVSWGGDLARDGAPSGCLFMDGGPPDPWPPRIYFNSYANSGYPCGTGNFACWCPGDGGDDDERKAAKAERKAAKAAAAEARAAEKAARQAARAGKGESDE